MARKRFVKGNAKKKKAPREEDAALRLNHLFAASTILSEKAPSVAKFYARASKQICRRVNITVDSVTVKRMFCKKCDGTLLPGVGNHPPTYRIASRRERHLVVKCGNCGFLKRYLARPPDHSHKKGKKIKVCDAERKVEKAHVNQREPKSDDVKQKSSASDVMVSRDQEAAPRREWVSSSCQFQ
ncbi:unnamed protein product [Agarophyton chilense]